jgi:hypothetical protein
MNELITMVLKVRVRLCGDSLAITAPRQIARMHNIEKRGYMELSPIGTGEFRIAKVYVWGNLSF